MYVCFAKHDAYVMRTFALEMSFDMFGCLGDRNLRTVRRSFPGFRGSGEVTVPLAVEFSMLLWLLLQLLPLSD